MANLEYLKPVLGDELYTSFLEKMSDAHGITLVNAADGNYVPKAKFDTELAAKKQYLAQMESLGKEKASLDAEIVTLKDQLTQASEDSAQREEAANRDAETILKLQEEVKQLSADLQQKEQEAKTAGEYKGEVDRLTGMIAEKDKAIETIRKQGKLSSLLREAGARNPDMLMRMIDLERVKESDGKITGLEEQLKALRTSDPYLFIDQPAPRGGVDSMRSKSGQEPTLNQQVNLEIRRAAGYNL